MDEEAQKRKTDCVYFLASPLTCKKGNDCDYRHSESARINPRDCWFWLSGNCLNANCPFRHPPLDGRPAAATAATTPVAPAVPASKSRVPCYYFSQGFCAKGDKCSFMHGPLLAQNTEAQKQPKPATAKDTLPSDKQGLTSQGNGSVISKPLSESSQEVRTISETKPTLQSKALTVNVKDTRPSYEPVVIPNDAAKVSALECSGSSGPTRPRRQDPMEESSLMKALKIEDRLKILKPEDQLCLPQPTDEGVRHGQTREDRLRHIKSHVQPVDERLCQVHSGEKRIRNGVESEEWGEESLPGFDVLVDDGLDQLAYPEEADYLSHHDIAMESERALSRKRVISTDDLAEFEYDHPGSYDQSGYYDASSKQYDHGSYDPYDQHPGYDHVSSYDHLGRQHAVVHRDKAVESTVLRDRHGIVTEQKIRHSIAIDDLRNHISKRRRLERAHQLTGDAHRRRQHQEILVSGFPHDRRNQGDRLRQQDRTVQHRMPAGQETRSISRHIGPSYGLVSPERISSRRSPFKHSSGDYVRVSGKERECRRTSFDIGPNYGLVSPERISSRSSPIKGSLGDHVRVTGKERERRQPSLESVTVLEHGGYNSSNKTDFRKDESDFTGPKSLAQIKAEKRKASIDVSLKASDMFNEPNITLLSIPQSNHASQHQGLPLKSQVSPFPGLLFDTICRGESSFDDRKRSLDMALEMESTKALDFEGPKPLSAILKEKKKIKSEMELRPEELRKENASKKVYPKPDIRPGLEGSVSFNVNSESFEKDVEDGELLPDDNFDLPMYMPHDNGNDLKHCELLKETVDHTAPVAPVKQTLVLVSAAMTKVDEAMGEMHRIVEVVDPPKDMTDGAEHGDNVLEDEEYGTDEEDDDDFAKKLGGFFS